MYASVGFLDSLDLGENRHFMHICVCAAPFVTAATDVRLIPQDLRALYLDIFEREALAEKCGNP